MYQMDSINRIKILQTTFRIRSFPYLCCYSGNTHDCRLWIPWCFIDFCGWYSTLKYIKIIPIDCRIIQYNCSIKYDTDFLPETNHHYRRKNSNEAYLSGNSDFLRWEIINHNSCFRYILLVFFFYINDFLKRIFFIFFKYKIEALENHFLIDYQWIQS